MLDHLKDHLPLLQYAHILWGFGLFVGLALWVYRPSGKRQQQSIAERILQDDETVTDKRGHHGAHS